MRRLFLAALLMCVAACNGKAPPSGDSLDAIARDYVQLSLTIGEKEEGYIDAYYGPPELQAQAKAEAPRLNLEQLSQRTEQLRSRAQAFEDVGDDQMAQRRARFLVAQLTAAATRLRMLRGEKLSFEDEAEGLFGVRPEVQPLENFDSVIASVEQLVPGEGPLSDRIEAFANRFNIPKDRLKPVFDAAIAECRRRTLQHIQLPPNERFDLSFVTGKSWSGYNYYQGNAHSRIEINTDLPIRIPRAVDLGCHEGYPGHHVLNALLEQKLVKDRGWVEFSVYPLYSPQSLLAEGSANYGILLAFPGNEQIEFEKRVIYPLAGLPVEQADAYTQLQKALERLGAARFTVAKQLLEGSIDEAEAARLLQRYELASAERAKKSVEFIKQYRSYVINYGLGKDMVRADVEAAGNDPAARWKRMAQLLSEPTLPSDLKGGR
ncbi:MAG TPA: hypothetical protein VD768_00525 [Sphingomicrobium sp.]|nr:hypothetical protein [Sphingomicrobium sp.]